MPRRWSQSGQAREPRPSIGQSSAKCAQNPSSERLRQERSRSRQERSRSWQERGCSGARQRARLRMATIAPSARARLRMATDSFQRASAFFSEERADGHDEWFRPQRVYPGARRSRDMAWVMATAAADKRLVSVSCWRASPCGRRGWVLERGPWFRLLPFPCPQASPLGRISPNKRRDFPAHFSLDVSKFSLEEKFKCIKQSIYC